MSVNVARCPPQVHAVDVVRVVEVVDAWPDDRSDTECAPRPACRSSRASSFDLEAVGAGSGSVERLRAPRCTFSEPVARSPHRDRRCRDRSAVLSEQRHHLARVERRVLREQERGSGRDERRRERVPSPLRYAGIAQRLVARVRGTRVAQGEAGNVETIPVPGRDQSL